MEHIETRNPRALHIDRTVPRTPIHVYSRATAKGETRFD